MNIFRGLAVTALSLGISFVALSSYLQLVGVALTQGVIVGCSVASIYITVAVIANHKPFSKHHDIHH